MVANQSLKTTRYKNNTIVSPCHFFLPARIFGPSFSSFPVLRFSAPLACTEFVVDHIINVFALYIYILYILCSAHGEINVNDYHVIFGSVT